MKKRRRRPTNKQVFIGIGLIALVALIVALYWVPGSGFDAYPPEVTRDKIQPQREKTLWDWLDLLIVPAVLAVGAYLFNQAEKKNDRAIAEDNQRERALQTYLDRMSELLLKENLLQSQPGDEVRAVARS